MHPTSEPADTEPVDWAHIRDVIVTHTLITIRHRCHQLRSETDPDRLVAGLGEVGTTSPAWRTCSRKKKRQKKRPCVHLPLPARDRASISLIVGDPPGDGIRSRPNGTIA